MLIEPKVTGTSSDGMAILVGESSFSTISNIAIINSQTSTTALVACRYFSNLGSLNISNIFVSGNASSLTAAGSASNYYFKGTKSFSSLPSGWVQVTESVPMISGFVNRIIFTDYGTAYSIYCTDYSNDISSLLETTTGFLGCYDSSGKQVYDADGKYVAGDYWTSDGICKFHKDITLTLKWDIRHTLAVVMGSHVSSIKVTTSKISY
ncbi:MAG: hypothetical protein MJ149_01945, partial [Clostridia bacterium]|nr:hypothetical protein [Clostridia bacterium]